VLLVIYPRNVHSDIYTMPLIHEHTTFWYYANNSITIRLFFLGRIFRRGTAQMWSTNGLVYTTLDFLTHIENSWTDRAQHPCGRNHIRRKRGKSTKTFFLFDRSSQRPIHHRGSILCRIAVHVYNIHPFFCQNSALLFQCPMEAIGRRTFGLLLLSRCERREK